MKKVFIICIFFTIFSTHSLLGQVSIGIRGGANFASQNISGNLSDSFDVNHVTGFSASAIIEMEISEFFSIQPEAVFIEKGRKTVSELSEGTLKFTRENQQRFRYLEIPVLAKLKLGNESLKFNLMAGPSFGFALSGEEEIKTTINGGSITESTTLNFEESKYNRFEMGAVAGLGGTIYFGSFAIFADYRFLYGISDLDNGDNEVTVKNKGSNVGAGILISF